MRTYMREGRELWRQLRAWPFAAVGGEAGVVSYGDPATVVFPSGELPNAWWEDPTVRARWLLWRQDREPPTPAPSVAWHLGDVPVAARDRGPVAPRPQYEPDQSGAIAELAAHARRLGIPDEAAAMRRALERYGSCDVARKALEQMARRASSA